MSLLKPTWEQAKPSSRDAEHMSKLVTLEPSFQADHRIDQVLERLRTTHIHGGAFFATFSVGQNSVFDWFASRNRLLEFEILPQLLHREEIRSLLPELNIPRQTAEDVDENACSLAASDGFNFDRPFLIDGQLGQALFAGGAYESEEKITGREAMRLAGEFCEAVFGKRYEEVSLYSSCAAWTPWFCGIAWDWTSVLFDRRERKLSLLAVTDTD